MRCFLLCEQSFSFSMENNGRWSSANNQRKYRVSQLYVQLLEIVRIDALRDLEHAQRGVQRQPP